MKDQNTMTRAKESVRRDDDIMATNNSSIVSKRSVERLYFSQEPEFFRYFVKKPQRRSPLINRGYWLRMKAIDHVVRQFLEEPSEKPKYVINLGCGYDPLPWQCLSRYPEMCKNTIFIDADYPQLLEKKCATVLATPALNQNLTNLSTPKKEGVILKSDQYVQIGCDLRDVTALSKILESQFSLQDSPVLFTAEVSITYMRLPYADDLIRWAGTYPDARFCLLEQIIPDGPDHPFAKTMLAHFKKLQTPLQSVELYPTVDSQKSRFRERGWQTVNAKDLWELWGSRDFLTSDERMALNLIEPFDEWEEFALFGQHYFLLVASTAAEHDESLPDADSAIASDATISRTPLKTQYMANKTGVGRRRFGASLLLDQYITIDEGQVANHAGMGLDTRLSSFDVYSPQIRYKQPKQAPPRGPSPRMCHSIVDLGDTAFISGGRTSPDNALADCWLYHKKDNTFERVQDLPIGRFRHTAVKINNEFVLVYGGKSHSRTIEEDCLQWNRYFGWRKIPQSGITRVGITQGQVYEEEIPPASFGATMVTHYSDTGLLMGGISKDGIVLPDLWTWKIEWGDYRPESRSISFQKVQDPAALGLHYFSRFGASVTYSHSKVYVVGGIAPSLLTADTEIMVFMMDMTSTERSMKVGSCGTCPLALEIDVPRPILIGVSTVTFSSSTLVMGGGAVCFSFGSRWNEGSYEIMHPRSASEDPMTLQYYLMLKPWKLLESTPKVSGSYAERAKPISARKRSQTAFDTAATIPRVRITDAEDFERIMRASTPVIIEGLDLGTCTSLWSAEYLKETVGPDREVVVHEATTKNMDFQTKNFRYSKKTFGDFIQEAEIGGKLYLRALSEEQPSEKPTDLSRDFPTIAPDFRLPPELRFVAENAHSSPLRISGDVAMWLHYDVMANILCQIRGTKRLLLFPPSDIQHLNFSPGASSSSIDPFSPSNSTIPGTHPHEAILDSGDILFLPALWLHAAAPLSGFSVAVNVFFRNLETGYAAGRDVYGNRDLAAYEKGRMDLGRIVKSFEGLPGEVREFYLLRLAGELRDKAA